MEELQRLYEDYLDLVAQLQRDRKPFEGAFGLGGGPAAHPCHQQFAKDVEQAMARVPEEQRLQAIEYIFQQALDHKGDPLVYWMFMAVHGATLPYLKGLTSQQARDLQWWYEKAYPRSERMPCQKRVLSTLKKMR
ncbi:hypothetical protein [Pseudoflavonifractor sp. An85]|uniref:hypothetical protein n=1 Tax=Pseudoflavonifractor sp. An85 TaxID=1965661 RepID=UPI000B37244A|nr:hypothetical protein [Pseudoflavonifractor sp. An85]OUN20332.1 hypothetical protein B5G37_12535 [Pseudoflavonifractor sp. An85]